MTQETDYSKMVTDLSKPGKEIIEEMTPLQAHCLHMALGVCGEAGELLDAVKKNSIYQKAVNRKNIVEELGDLEFFMEGVRQGHGITREETILANTNKLSVRYKNSKYSNQAAQERADKKAE